MGEEDMDDDGEMDDEMDDFGETNQISPTQTSPDRESDIENNKSENIRNFMQHAQPAANMMNSNMNSDMQNPRMMDQQNFYPGHNMSQHQDDNSNTNEKEGGSIESQP